jgi:hypothetical protein
MQRNIATIARFTFLVSQMFNRSHVKKNESDKYFDALSQALESESLSGIEVK